MKNNRRKFEKTNTRRNSSRQKKTTFNYSAMFTLKEKKKKHDKLNRRQDKKLEKL